MYNKKRLLLLLQLSLLPIHNDSIQHSFSTFIWTAAKSHSFSALLLLAQRTSFLYCVQSASLLIIYHVPCLNNNYQCFLTAWSFLEFSHFGKLTQLHILIYLSPLQMCNSRWSLLQESCYWPHFVHRLQWQTSRPQRAIKFLQSWRASFCLQLLEVHSGTVPAEVLNSMNFVQQREKIFDKQERQEYLFDTMYSKLIR